MAYNHQGRKHSFKWKNSDQDSFDKIAFLLKRILHELKDDDGDCKNNKGEDKMDYIYRGRKKSCGQKGSDRDELDKIVFLLKKILHEVGDDDNDNGRDRDDDLDKIIFLLKKILHEIGDDDDNDDDDDDDLDKIIFLLKKILHEIGDDDDDGKRRKRHRDCDDDDDDDDDLDKITFLLKKILHEVGDDDDDDGKRRKRRRRDRDDDCGC